MNAVGHDFLARMVQALGPRETQQDACFVLPKAHHLILGVFDGMGGHAFGAETALAASLAVQAFARRTKMVEEPSLRAWVERALLHAHEDACRAKGGTTATVAILDRRQQRVVVGWAGDSPCIMMDVSDGAFRARGLTRPHGVGNRLFNGLGRIFDAPSVEVATAPLGPSALVVVASDGILPWELDLRRVARWARRRFRGGGAGVHPGLSSDVLALALEADGPVAQDNVTAVFGTLASSRKELDWIPALDRLRSTD